MVVRDPPTYLIRLNALLVATATSSIRKAKHLPCRVDVEMHHPAWTWESGPFYAGVKELAGQCLRYLDTKENYCLVDRARSALLTVGTMEYLPIRDLLKCFEYDNGVWYNASQAAVAHILRASPTMPKELP